jgi:hypothetical protein
MRIDFHGLVFDAPRVSVYLWSPWRSTALEHRLFEAVRHAARRDPEPGPDEMRLDLADPKAWRGALQAVVRVLKGWQEEGDPGRERRTWRWMLEADCDAGGYDNYGEPVSLWFYLRLGLDRGGPGEPDRGEDIDLEGFGIRVWPENR